MEEKERSRCDISEAFRLNIDCCLSKEVSVCRADCGMRNEVRADISKRCAVYGLCGEESRGAALLLLSIFAMTEKDDLKANARESCNS